jgi:hypothetical protein
MGSRILNVAACCFVAVWPIAVHGQGPDAQSVTQSVLDQHKSADPTNSARALTGKSQEFDISKIPPPSGRSPKTTRPSPKALQRIRELEEKKKKFVSKKVEKQFTETTFFALDATTAQGKANQDWEKRAQRKGNQDWEEKAQDKANQKWEETDEGKTLRRLKAEVAEASKARRKTEFDISDIPLPRSSPR